MSLDFNLSEIKNYEQVCYEIDKDGHRTFADATESIIWTCMAIGMGTITRKNAGEFYARTVANAMESQPFISREDVYFHIGLTTNVTTITRAAFLKGLARKMDYIADAEEAVCRAIEGSLSNVSLGG